MGCDDCSLSWHESQIKVWLQSLSNLREGFVTLLRFGFDWAGGHIESKLCCCSCLALSHRGRLNASELENPHRPLRLSECEAEEQFLKMSRGWSFSDRRGNGTVSFLPSLLSVCSTTTHFPYRGKKKRVCHWAEEDCANNTSSRTEVVAFPPPSCSLKELRWSWWTWKRL